MNDGTEVKPRSLRFTWSMKTTSSRDPNEIMAEIKKVNFCHLMYSAGNLVIPHLCFRLRQRLEISLYFHQSDFT